MNDPSPLPSRHGFSLIEVMLALGIGTFCLVILMAMMPVGIASNKASFSETSAASIASEVFADLRNATGVGYNADGTPSAASIPSPQFSISIPSPGTAVSTNSIFVLDNGTVTNTASLPASARYRVSVVLTPPAATPSHGATAARVFITWPAQASVAPASYAGSFEAEAYLNRN